MSDPLELELQQVVRDPMWTVGHKLRSSGRERSVIDHWAICPALRDNTFKIKEHYQNVNFWNEWRESKWTQCVFCVSMHCVVCATLEVISRYFQRCLDFPVSFSFHFLGNIFIFLNKISPKENITLTWFRCFYIVLTYLGSIDFGGSQGCSLLYMKLE